MATLTSIEQALVVELENASTTAGNRIYPGEIPQNADLPAITYEGTGREPIMSMGNLDNTLKRPNYRLECFADTSSASETLLDEVIAALNIATTYELGGVTDTGINVQAITLDPGDTEFDETDRIWVRTLDVTIWH